jgi:AraC family transcriptional regulator
MTSPDRFELIQRPAETVMAIRREMRADEVGQAMAECLPGVFAHVMKQGGAPARRPYMRYHRFGERVDLECGIPVQVPLAEADGVRAGEIPAGRYARGWHMGPFEGLAASHQALLACCEAEGLGPAGPPIEVYWSDPQQEPDPAKWRTEILLPVAGG